MNSSRKLVTVVIPVYNASPYVQDAIESVLCQTYPNIEIIVIDDGSTDNSSNIIADFEDKLTYIRQPNKGVSAARNLGFEKSKGYFISFLDADDWMYPANIEEKVKLFERDLSLGLVHSKVDVCDKLLHSSGSYLIGKSGKNLVQSLLNMELPIPCPSNVLIKRTALEKVGTFDVNLSTSADFELWLRLCDKFSAGFVDDFGIKYRLHTTNMSSKTDLYDHDISYIRKNYQKHFLNYNWDIFALKNDFYLLLAGIKKIRIKMIARYSSLYIKDFLKKFLKNII